MLYTTFTVMSSFTGNNKPITRLLRTRHSNMTLENLYRMSNVRIILTTYYMSKIEWTIKSHTNLTVNF